MILHFYKYQGTGNDFIMIDNRDSSLTLNSNQIKFLCSRHFGIGADGLIVLEDHKDYDFYMKYYNADGNESSMCGNGGRCLVAFAYNLGIIKNETLFLAIDGEHHAEINQDIVSLGMKSVEEINLYQDHTFLNTGSPHHVCFVTNLKEFPVFEKGKEIRNGSPYFNEGTNVNFVEIVDEDTIFVRTYERGVEDETLSCGTGITASAISAYKKGLIKDNCINIQSLGGRLSVSFSNVKENLFEDIKLTGPAKKVFEGEISI